METTATPEAAVQPRKRSLPSLAVQASGAVLWGTFFSVTFFDLLIPGALIWVPLLVWRESTRAKKHGFQPGFLIRVGIVLAILFAAAWAPVKEKDLRRLELSRSVVSLDELSRVSRIYGFQERDLSRQVTLPSNHPTLGEVIDAVEAQTEYGCSVGHCGNGVTVLWGKSIMGIGVTPRR